MSEQKQRKYIAVLQRVEYYTERVEISAVSVTEADFKAQCLLDDGHDFDGECVHAVESVSELVELREENE